MRGGGWSRRGGLAGVGGRAGGRGVRRRDIDRGRRVAMAPDGASPDSVSPGMCGADVPPGQACNALANVGATAITPTCARGTAPVGDGRHDRRRDVRADVAGVLPGRELLRSPLPLSETVAIRGRSAASRLVFGGHSVRGPLSGTTDRRQGTGSTAFTQTCRARRRRRRRSPRMGNVADAARTRRPRTTLTLFAVYTATGASDVAVFTRR